MTICEKGDLLRVKKRFKMYFDIDKSEYWVEPGAMYCVAYAEHWVDSDSHYYELNEEPLNEDSVSLRVYDNMIDNYFERIEE